MADHTKIIAGLCVLLPIVAGCGKRAAAPATEPAKPAEPPRPSVDYSGLRVDETGAIPVVMYHDVAGSRNDKMFRTPESFRKDLQLLHEKGFHPVNLRDVTANRIAVPAGKSPVVITFDDARQSQFNLIESEKSYQIDPKCAVGILEDFCKAHPEWKPAATFFVLPKSKRTQETFGQTGLGAQKLQYLLDKGYEIGNHSTNHRTFRSMSAKTVQEELAVAQAAIVADAPKAEVVSFALPYGALPRDKKVQPFLATGTHAGTTYRHTGVCLAAWRPMHAPGTRKYNPLRIERITPEDMRFGLKYWVDELASGRLQRYISDGDPTTVSFPASAKSNIDAELLRADGVRANPYGGAGGGSKPIVSAGEAAPAKPILGEGADTTTPPSTPKPISGN